MNTSTYQKFWTAMVFLLSFCTAGFFLGAMLIFDEYGAERRRNEAFQNSLNCLLVEPSNCGGRIAR
jgi:hypothetical protein